VRPEGRIRASGVDKDVTVVDADHDIDDELDAVYRAKYHRYSANTISRITSPGRDPPRSSWCRAQRVPRSAHHSVPRNQAAPRPWRNEKLEIQPKNASTKGPAEMFTGDVWYDVIAQGREPSRMRVNVVRFAPGARTAWHSHAVGQTLHVTEGAGLIQSRGGEVVEIRPGDTIHTPPGEWHWHGAAPDHFMTHIAMWEGPGEDQGPESEWGDLVTDEEYNVR
jgi:quercetin dioxygenase-like cupin family protein